MAGDRARTCLPRYPGGGDGRGSGPGGGSSRRSCTWTAPGAPGGICPWTSRPGRPSIPTSRPGAMTARWPGCTNGCAPRSGPRPGARPSPPPRSSIPSRCAPRTPCPRASRGWDAAKKVNGRKRHIAVDTTGLVLDVVITPASVQDRDGARPLLWNLHRACRRVRLVWADAGYTGKLAAWAATLKMTLADRRQARRACLRGAAPPLGRRADLRLDQQAPPHRPRLRAPARQPRSHDLVGHDRPHDPPPGPDHRFIRRSLSLPFNLRVRAWL